MTVAERIIEIVRELPGATSQDIASLIDMSHVHTKHLLTAMTRDGILARERMPRKGRGRQAYGYNVAPNPPPAPAPKPRKPRENPLLVDALRRDLAKLQEWKRKAIERFPDLGVAPVVLKARKLAAEGYPEKASEINAGHLDNKPLIQLLVRALEETV